MKQHEVTSAGALAKILYEVDPEMSITQAKRLSHALLENFEIYWRQDAEPDPASFASRASHASS
jgi:hypothetical protein